MAHLVRLITLILVLQTTPLARSASPPVPQAPASAADTHAHPPRESWQRIPDIFAAMGAEPGAVVADIGAGDGYFTARLAAAVGAEGRVLAVDINDSALARLGRRLERDGLTNVTAILGTPADPRLPPNTLDAALIVNAYHEMTQAAAMLAAIRTALKPTGRLVIVEPISDAYRDRPRVDQADRHEIAPVFVQRDAIDAGFVIARMDDPFTRRGGNGVPEYLVVLRKNE